MYEVKCKTNDNYVRDTVGVAPLQTFNFIFALEQNYIKKKQSTIFLSIFDLCTLKLILFFFVTIQIKQKY